MTNPEDEHELGGELSGRIEHEVREVAPNVAVAADFPLRAIRKHELEREQNDERDQEGPLGSVCD